MAGGNLRQQLEAYRAMGRITTAAGRSIRGHGSVAPGLYDGETFSKEDFEAAGLQLDDAQLRTAQELVVRYRGPDGDGDDPFDMGNLALKIGSPVVLIEPGSIMPWTEHGMPLPQLFCAHDENLTLAIAAAMALALDAAAGPEASLQKTAGPLGAKMS